MKISVLSAISKNSVKNKFLKLKIFEFWKKSLHQKKILNKSSKTSKRSIMKSDPFWREGLRSSQVKIAPYLN